MNPWDLFEGWDRETVVWCLHCERVYRVADMRKVKGYWCCAYEDCSGTLIDGWSLPEPWVPEDWRAGVFYPQYPVASSG